MLKLTFINIKNKSIYFKLFLNLLILGISFLLISYMLVFSVFFERKIIGSDLSKNYGRLYSSDVIDVSAIEEYDFVEDVTCYHDYSPAMSNFLLNVDGSSFIFEDIFFCFSIDKNTKLVSNNVIKEYNTVMLYGDMPNSDSEMVLNESFVDRLGFTIEEIIGKTIEFYSPSNLPQDIRNDLFLKKTVVGVMSNNLFSEDTFENDSVVLIYDDLEKKYYYNNAVVYKVYYNTFENAESFYSIIKNDTNYDFFHGMNADFMFINYVKKYFNIFSSIFYIFFALISFSLVVLLFINIDSEANDNYEQNLILFCYGAKKDAIIKEKTCEYLFLLFMALFLCILLGFILNYSLGEFMIKKFDILYKLKFSTVILINIPFVIISFFSILIYLFLKKRRLF